MCGGWSNSGNAVNAIEKEHEMARSKSKHNRVRSKRRQQWKKRVKRQKARKKTAPTGKK